MASAAEGMAYEEYSELTPRHTEPYQATIVRHEYERIDQDAIWKNVSINWLFRIVKEEMLKIKTTSNLSTNTDRNRKEWGFSWGSKECLRGEDRWTW